MAVAVAGEGETKMLVTTLERRIAGSQRAWEIHHPEIATSHPDYFPSAPVELERKSGRWLVTETMCTWVGLRPTVMPLCDVIKVIAPRELVEDPLLPAPGTVFLELERVLSLTGSAVVSVETLELTGARCEVILLQGFPPEELEELLVGARKEFPAQFNPGG